MALGLVKLESGVVGARGLFVVQEIREIFLGRTLVNQQGKKRAVVILKGEGGDF